MEIQICGCQLFISFLEQNGRSSSRLLGAIHRYISLAKCSFRIQLLESEKAYSYTGFNMQRLVIDNNRVVDQLDQFFGYLHRGFGRSSFVGIEAVDNYNEFIATQAAGNVLGSGDGSYSFGSLNEHCIAHSVPVNVVYQLESIQVY